MALSPPIDLRHSQLFIEDGYGAVGAVNNALGYAIGATTMVVDGFTSALAAGDTFTLTGDDTEYTVTAHTETTGATTSITFTPGLVIAATDNEVVTVGPHKLEVRIGEGNLQFTETNPLVYVRNHDQLDTVKFGPEETTKVSFDFVWDQLVGDTDEPPTVKEALGQFGNAANWVTSAVGRPCEPYAVRLRFVHTPACPNTKLDEIIFEDFRPDTQAHDLKNAQVAVTGQSNRTRATYQRVEAAA